MMFPHDRYWEDPLTHRTTACDAPNDEDERLDALLLLLGQAAVSEHCHVKDRRPS